MNNERRMTTAALPCCSPAPTRFLWLLGLIFLLSGLFLAITPGPIQAAPPAQAPDSPPSVTGGRPLWVENCQPCHGPTGKGDGPNAQAIEGPLPDFSNPETARRLVPAENFDVIKNGRIEKLMPPWGNRLSDAEIWDAAAYLWSLSTKPQDLAAGETLYLEQCAACHGENGSGDGPEAAADMIDFTDLQVMSGRSQADLQANFVARDEHAQFSSLLEAELWQTLDYIRSFSFTVPQRNGLLTGQVINATTGEPMGDLEVTLHVFQNDTEIETQTTQADSAGNFTFEKLLTDHSVLYVLEGRYQNVVYLSDAPAIFTPDTTETTLNLNVYETTTSDDGIAVTQLHYLLSFSPGMVNVVQIFVVGNSGNQAYIGQNGQTFSFSLPDMAAGVRFQDDAGGTRFVRAGDGYADTAPVLPGEEGLTIVALYDIPFDNDALELEFPLAKDVASVNVLLSDQGADLSSEQVRFVETRQIQGRAFSIFSGGNLKQGDRLTFKLTGLDALEFPDVANVPGATVPAHQIDQNILRWIAVGLGGLAIVVAAVVYPLVRPPLTHQADIHYEDPETRRQKLLLTLARLDEAFEAGELDEAVYYRARARYKAELVEVMEEL